MRSARSRSSSSPRNQVARRSSDLLFAQLLSESSFHGSIIVMGRCSRCRSTLLGSTKPARKNERRPLVGSTVFRDFVGFGDDGLSNRLGRIGGRVGKILGGEDW